MDIALTPRDLDFIFYSYSSCISSRDAREENVTAYLRNQYFSNPHGAQPIQSFSQCLRNSLFSPATFRQALQTCETRINEYLRQFDPQNTLRIQLPELSSYMPPHVLNDSEHQFCSTIEQETRSQSPHYESLRNRYPASANSTLTDFYDQLIGFYERRNRTERAPVSTSLPVPQHSASLPPRTRLYYGFFSNSLVSVPLGLFDRSSGRNHNYTLVEGGGSVHLGRRYYLGNTVMAGMNSSEGNLFLAVSAFLDLPVFPERDLQVRSVLGHDREGLVVGGFLGITSHGTVSTCSLQRVFFPWIFADPRRFHGCIHHPQRFSNLPTSTLAFTAGVLVLHGDPIVFLDVTLRSFDIPGGILLDFYKAVAGMFFD